MEDIEWSVNAAGARHVPVATFFFFFWISFIRLLVFYLRRPLDVWTAEEDGFLLGAGCWLDGVGFPLVCWQM